ncbi:glycosyltransferase family 2 protein [Hymenobacter koreensis]|uniref:Glycosyltransferase family 2 protein n=1 Tax=Hymenobacter koreensis TaxID=1084523 RepID=A0ABP8ITY5_9BACT
MTHSVPYLSVVSPVYRGGELLPELVGRLVNSLASITPYFEIVLVDDRSPDDAWVRIQDLCQQEARVKGIRLSRNFGQHAAIAAGLSHCQGEWVVVMDNDLQDLPEEIPSLLKHARQHNLDYVLASRRKRKHSRLHRGISYLFYCTLYFLTDVKQDATVGNFGLYHQRVIQAVRQMPERVRFFPVMVQWVGFTGGIMPVEHAARPGGGSSYRWGQRFHLALDVVLAYSAKPLRLTVMLGLLVMVLAFLLGMITLIRYWIGQISVPGYTSLVLLMCFFSGLCISVLGMVGLYVGRTFEETKQRPIYIVDTMTTPE